MYKVGLCWMSLEFNEVLMSVTERCASTEHMMNHTHEILIERTFYYKITFIVVYVISFN